jgi:hypothetical protein
MGIVSLKFRDLAQAQSCSHAGQCDMDVEALARDPIMASMLFRLDANQVRDVLRETGGWEAHELADHDANLRRILWIAACDVAENPDDFDDEAGDALV